MLPTLQIGPVSLQTPGLLIILGLWLGLALAERNTTNNALDPSKLYNFTIITLLAALIGARLVYILRYPQAFIANPLSIISINPGLLDTWGALTGVILSILIFSKHHRLSFWSILDTITPLAAVIAVAVHLSNLASGSAFGAVTSQPWAIDLWGAQRHPAQVYEAIAALTLLLLLWPGRKPATSLQQRVAGRYFLTFLASSAAVRLFLEAFRGDSVIGLGGVRQAQVLAWLILALCLWMLHSLKDPPVTSRNS